METGNSCNDWISWSNNNSVWPPRIEALEKLPGRSRRHKTTPVLCSVSLLSRQRENHFSTRELRLSEPMAQQCNNLAGCSKRPSSKAAGESKPEAYPQGYVEDFDELRTKLAGFFSILPLDIWDLPVNLR